MRAMLAALCAAWALSAGAYARETSAIADDVGRTAAQHLISEADAVGVFEALAGGEQIRVRHIGSGLICAFSASTSNRLVLFPTFARGHDVGCDNTGERTVISLYATHYPQRTTLSEQLVGAEMALRMRFAGAAPYAPEHEMSLTRDDIAPPESATARYLFTDEEGVRQYSRISVAIVDGWTIKLRYTTDAPDDAALMTAELESSLIWGATLADIVSGRST